MIDSHCHLAGEEFAQDLDAVVARARAAGLVRCLVILAADEDAEFERAGRVSRAWPDVKYSIGVHPHHAHRFADSPDAAAGLTADRLQMMPGACAIGEIGLDYHYDFSPRDVQHAVFRVQLELARSRNLPVVIHTREAEEDTLRIISEESLGQLRGVFHCFSGDTAAARRALGSGFHISIPGIVTFPKSSALRDAARAVPIERLLVETDSPYLAPVPHRGRPNRPSLVPVVGAAVAEAMGVTVESVAEASWANADRVYRLGRTISG
jgi:TatD DNase family protein